MSEREIPDDVREAANKCMDRFTYMNDTHWREFVAEAILAERERAAKTAIELTKANPQRNAKDQWREQIGKEISDAIRQTSTKE